MAKAYAKKLYNSKAWITCRDSYIQMVHGLCERCLAKGEYKPGYIVHHKIILNASNINDPTITLNHEHLEYLCLDCHNKEHFGDACALSDGLVFDEFGNIIERCPPIKNI